jgi:beta-N-acetylhexosaminidase
VRRRANLALIAAGLVFFTLAAVLFLAALALGRPGVRAPVAAAPSPGAAAAQPTGTTAAVPAGATPVPAVPTAATGGPGASLVNPTAASRVEALLARLSTAEKVGQLLLFGFDGTDTAAASALIEQDRVGGIVLVGRNVSSPRQLAELNRRLQERAAAQGAGVPLLLSIDQEGGEVVRIQSGATVFPSQMALGATQSRDLAYAAGRASGAELRALGVNMVLAPVLDVNDNPDNPVIGLRSYGERPELVAALGDAYLRGVQEQGVLAVAKHFPGHGSTGVDSHLELPVVAHGRAEVDRRELPPFRSALGARVGAVMTGHLLFPGLDPEYPATVSPAIIDGLLRRELGFEGLVMTDDLEMAGITGRYGTSGAAVRAIKAGADQVMVVWTRDRQVATRRALLDAVERGEITEGRLDASVRRILLAKERAGLFGPPPALDPAVVGAAAHRGLAEQIARSAITVVRAGAGALPARASGARVFVVAPTRLPAAGSGTALGEAVRARGAQVQELVVDLDSESSKANALARAPALAAGADLVLVATWDSGPWQTSLVRAVGRAGRPYIVLGFGTPYELAGFPEVPTYLAVYGRTPDQVTAAAAVVFGEVRAGGRLPVSIPGVAESAAFAP